MKNNIEFYQHYANSDQHPKFKMLRTEFGWSGEGRFWALNNRIAQSDKCCLNISKKYNKAAIASDLNLNLQQFDAFITFLLKDCELIIECETGIITTDIIQENFNRVTIDRASARKRSKKRWGDVQGSLPKTNRTSKEQSKSSAEQSSKGKESKGNILYTHNFLLFWKEYPKKKSKGDAFKAYQNIKEPKPKLSEILKAINQHQKTEDWKTIKYIPYPATWINQRRWEDETDIINNVTSIKPRTDEDIEQERREAFL